MSVCEVVADHSLDVILGEGVRHLDVVVGEFTHQCVEVEQVVRDVVER